MKSLLVPALCLAALCAQFGAAPALAGEEAKQQMSKFCKENDDFGLPHGACVSIFTNGNTTAHDAEVCRSASVRAYVKAENVGQCVKAMKELR